MKSHAILLVLILAGSLGLAVAQDTTKPGVAPAGPLSPRDEQATFKLPKGFVIELVASEPAVVDPVAMAFDEKGRLFVAEMHGYPNDGVGFGPVSSGKIKMLEDTDGDGYFEKSTVFAEGLRLPDSVMPYDGGLLVSNAPDLIYLKDTKGTGKADEKRVLYTGFDVANIQQMLNGLQWGLDNWVYGLAGGKGGTIKSLESADPQEVVLRGRGVRFKPDQPGVLEPISGGGQFGLASDDWGNWFVNTNSNHLRHIVLQDHYLRRNPDLAVTATTIDISDHGAACKVHRISPFEAWRVERTTRRKDGADSKRFAATELVPGGFVTSGCSPLIYGADQFPKEYRGNSFICDPANNLIHRDTLTPKGATFLAQRGHDDCEFLASTDNWFRPVFLCLGPDGAIYVADFYREIIETPLSLPDDIKKRWNLNSRAKGRIWRIRAAGPYQAPKVNLAAQSSKELVPHLDSPNRWWRLTAQRLLVERQHKFVVPDLERQARESRFTPGIVHTLWTLHGLKSLHPKWAIRLTQDPEPFARVQALRLAEDQLKGDKDGDEPIFDITPFRDLADDPTPQVRFQAAFTLREYPSSLYKILMRDAGDPWITTAVLSSLDSPRKASALLSLLAVDATRNNVSANHAAIVGKLGFLVSHRGSDDEIAIAFNALPLLAKQPALQAALLEGVSQGLQGRKLSLEKLLETPALRFSARFYGQVMQKALETAKNEKTPLDERVQALKLVSAAPFSLAAAVLEPLLSPQQPPALQLAAVKALAQHNQPKVAELLLGAWSGYSPSVRREVIDLLLARPERVRLLLTHIEEKKVRTNQLEPAKLELLRKYPDAKVRALAMKVLAGQVAPDRKKVLDQYQTALDLKPDPMRGKALFKKSCAVCHRLEDIGTEVGADLLSILPQKTPERLLIDILDPSREVDPRFLEYLLTTKDGKVLTGLIAADTAASVTLRRAEKSEDTILRSNLDTVQATTKSLMPEGLEMQLMPQDVADLIAYLTELGRKK